MITALAPCAIGYAEIGKRIVTDKNTNKENNPATRGLMFIVVMNLYKKARI